LSFDEMPRSIRQMVQTQLPVQVGDLVSEEDQDNSITRTGIELGGIRTVLNVPMVKEGELIGAFILSRQQVRAFTDKQIELRFVMTPSRLPSGDYELTLRSRQGNGKQATSHRSVAVTVQPSLTDQNIAPMTSGKASVVPAKPLVSSNVHHPSRTRREATGPAAQDLSGRPKLFNHVIGSHQ
jgi:hypothetical protein